MFPIGDPNRLIDHAVFDIDLNQVSPNDTLATTLKIGVAVKASPREFRMLGADGDPRLRGLGPR